MFSKILLPVLFFCSILFSQEFYVAVDGNDQNPGTEKEPFGTISKALSEITGEGYTIYVGPGYFEETALVIPYSSTSIFGWDTEIHQNNIGTRIIAMPTNQDRERFLYINLKENVHLKFLVFDFQNFSRPDNYGVYINRGGSNIIEKCSFYNMPFDPIVISNSNNNWILSNTVGPITLTGEQWTSLANSITIEANNTGTGSNDNHIYWNTIYPNNSHNGINLIVNQSQTSHIYSLNNDIDGNRIEGGWAGILMSDQKDFHIHNNLIYDAKGYSPQNGNILFDEEVAGHGIFLVLTSGTSTYWEANGKIYNNVLFYNYNTGIRNENAANIKIINNVFMNNALLGSSVNSWHCFKISPQMLDHEFSNNLYYNEPNHYLNSILRWDYNGISYDNGGGLLWNQESDPFIGNDPGFSDVGNRDFSVQLNSFVINKGLDLRTGGYYLTSFNGITRPAGTGTEIGAYELDDTSYDEFMLLKADASSLSTLDLYFNIALDSTTVKKSTFIGNDKDVKFASYEVLNDKRIRLTTIDQEPTENNIIEIRNLKSKNGKSLLPQFRSCRYSTANLSKKNAGTSITLSEYSLEQNYPNPFNPSTRIFFNIDKEEYVTLKVYDLLGREINTLLNEIMISGKHEILFDGTGLASGVYIYRITFGQYSEIKKMQLLK